MKNTIYLIIIAAAMIVNPLKAQETDYYTGKDTIKGKDYTYKITHTKNGGCIIENIKNEYFYKKMEFDTTVIKQFHPDGYTKLLEKDRLYMYQAFREAFSKEEIEYFKKNNTHNGLLDILFCTDKEGNILETKFSFASRNKFFFNMNPDNLYKYELLLKKNLKFDIWDILKGKISFAQNMHKCLFINRL